MGEFSWEKILVIGVIVLILFGSKKIPEMMRGLGKGMREFNDAKKGISDDSNTNIQNDASTTNNVKSSITDLEHENVSTK